MNKQQCERSIQHLYERINAWDSGKSYDSLIRLTETCKQFYNMKQIRDTLETELDEQVDKCSTRLLREQSYIYSDIDLMNKLKSFVIYLKFEWIRDELHRMLPYTNRIHCLILDVTEHILYATSNIRIMCGLINTQRSITENIALITRNVIYDNIRRLVIDLYRTRFL